MLSVIRCGVQSKTISYFRKVVKQFPNTFLHSKNNIRNYAKSSFSNPLCLKNEKSIADIFLRNFKASQCFSTFKIIEESKRPKKMETLSVPEKCQQLIRDNDVVLFSKSWCPFCGRVKALFKSLGITPVVYELDLESDGPQVQEYLYEFTKQKTVPNVFVQQTHVGGCDDTFKAYGDGRLQKLLQGPAITPIQQKIDQLLSNNDVAIFTYSSTPENIELKETFQALGVVPYVYELDNQPDGQEIHKTLTKKTGRSNVPYVFARGQTIGGSDDVQQAVTSGRLSTVLSGEGSSAAQKENYDYDIIVVGGGSGGLAAAKEAAQLGKKVALCDFVKPTPMGTTWGLGGTCVNVGCIPKKLMHQASLHRENIEDSSSFGWTVPGDTRQHNWEAMVENVQNYIKSLNFGYRKELNKRKVKYYNAFAEFLTPNKVKITNKKGEVEEITGKDFIIAVGGRPLYPDIPGAKEYCITSDDLFSLPQNPGKTLIVGASYIALECGGFLNGLNYDVTVMVRSILLRGFDRQMSDLIGEHMERMGVKFLREYVPVEVTKDESGKLNVLGRSKNVDEVFRGFDTVILAIGREACTSSLGFDKVPVKMNPRNKKVIVDQYERSSVPNIYAIGDVIDGKPELTPVAIHAGKYLAQRIIGLHNKTTNYKQVPTTVFTPVEYGCVGLSEEEAYEIFGENNVVVYHNAFKPLEHGLSRDETVGYAKLVCVKSLDELVVGFHVLSPNAGEITQGYAIGLKLGAKKADFDDLIGIHPTCAEVFTTMATVKNRGDKPPETTGC